MSSESVKKFILLAANAVTCLAWLRVLLVYVTQGWSGLSDDAAAVCEETLRPTLFWALVISTLELVTSLTGLTRSKPMQVLLFASVRTGTELWVTPLLGSCGAWQHLWTALIWSLGEVVRFGCFTVDGLVATRIVKSIRYTVGPILFPLGAGGEMFMVMRAASVQGRPMLYVAACLWPLGFYPLMKQLLKQRRKHFRTVGKKEIKSI